MEETFDIFVGSLLSCATQESVTKLFEKFGKIVKVRVMEKTGPKGMNYAFVHYSSEEAALKAIEEMSEFMYSGVPLQVRKSDRWLQRIGEEKSIKGKLKRLPSKVQNNSSATIGVWQPPSTSTVPILGAQPTVNTSMENTSAPASGPQLDGTTGKILKETIAVTHVEDPVTFYAYLGSKNSELDKLAIELQGICPTLNPICEDPVESKVYASMYSDDNQWYRCKVVKSDKASNRSLVQYIDYGNVENVANTNLIQLPHKLQVIQPYTMLCTLRNLVLTQGNVDHRVQAINRLKILVIDQMVSAVLHVAGNGSLQVSEMYHDGKNIVDIMLKEGYLMNCYNSENNFSNYVANNRRNSTQETASEKPKVVSQETKSVSANYSAVMISQENAQLEAENKRLKYEMSQGLGKQKALREELESLRQSIVEPNLFTELPVVISDIEKVRLFRQQLPVRNGSVDYIDAAVELLRKSKDVLRPFDKQHRAGIQEMVDQYSSLQGRILNCSDQNDQLEMINERNSLQGKLHKELTLFSSAVHSDEVLERVKEFRVVLQELRRVYQPFSKMQAIGLSSLPIEDFHSYYTSNKIEKAQEFLGLQRKTNLAHRNFFKALHPSSQDLDDCNSECTSLSDLMRALSELKACLSEEIKACSLENSSEACTVGVLSQLLRENLEQELVDMEDTERLDKRYSLLLKDLDLASESSFPPPAIQQLTEKRKQRKKLKSQLRHILADKMDLEENDEASESDAAEVNERLSEVHRELHRTFLEEDQLIASIAHLQASVFPELNTLYPDFGLQEYNKYKGIVKSGLEIEHFDLNPLPSLLHSETQYSSIFNDKPVRLKEIQVASENEKQDLLRNILEYSKISEPHLLPVETVFFTKKGVHAYVQQPLMQTLQSAVETKDLSDRETVQILRGILKGLYALHRRNLAHCRLHPSTVYLRPDNQAIVDSVPFQPHKCSEPLPPLNGIMFQAINFTTGVNCDIHSFACLCLWLLYPRTEFRSSPTGKPVVEDLAMDAWRACVIELVTEIFKSKTSNYQVSDILNHFAFTQDVGSSQLLEIPDVPDNFPCETATNQKNTNTWNCAYDYTKTLSDKNKDIGVLQDIFRECVRSE